MIDSAKQDEPTAAGFDSQVLSNMGYFKRCEALKDAGPDPDGYDF